MAQQTAVEWITERITDMIHESHHPELAELFQQAKEMEKQQIEDAYNKGTINGINYPISNLSLTGEQYYNETYAK